MKKYTRYSEKTLSRLMAGALSVSMLAMTAGAATWYMEDGDVTVTATETSQTVTQGTNTQEDLAPVFTNRTVNTADTSITVTTTEDATANITLKNMDLEKTGTGDGSCIVHIFRSFPGQFGNLYKEK